jgi:hypothetical protein
MTQPVVCFRQSHYCSFIIHFVGGPVADYRASRLIEQFARLSVVGVISELRRPGQYVRYSSCYPYGTGLPLQALDIEGTPLSHEGIIDINTYINVCAVTNFYLVFSRSLLHQHPIFMLYWPMKTCQVCPYCKISSTSDPFNNFYASSIFNPKE